jgi:AcrR family transcriptional regulator
MQEVADLAGLSIMSVYARFDGKSALVLALHERVIAHGLDQFDAALGDPAVAGAPLEGMVVEVVSRAVDFAEENAHVFRAVLAAADDETNQRAAAFVRVGSERLARLLGPRLPAGVDADRAVDFAWRSTVAVLQQWWVLWGAEPARFPLGRDALARRLARSFVAAVTTPWD